MLAGRRRVVRPQSGSGGRVTVHRPGHDRHVAARRRYNLDVARRRTPADPELAALARERLARLLGGPAGPPRRAEAPSAAAPEDDGWAARAAPGATVGVEDLEAPQRFTRWHLAVVAVVLLVGMVWGGWSWVRSRPEAVAAVPAVQPAVQTAEVPSAAAATVATSVPPTAVATPGSAPSAPGPVVHVLGAVVRPGLVRLEAGARVQDAIRAAGGLRPDADPDELNLAQPLEDGVQIVVGTRKHPEGEVRSGSGGSGGSATGSGGSSGAGTAPVAAVDLNAAGAEQLETLPGVGPVTAQKILDWRQQHGRFTSVTELQEVDGIGPKTYARIAPRARV